ncbi:hypothetical protein [Paenibacillus piri]|uniref:Uncharacterized protein n=1 Tax=Paenibacillus piri TaxID=2547395 RepID=A0A4R5KYE4_9BACL|nr:hypothetical protein [Paenibacillus piri]TDG00877.1 hypothetical protein E1757_04505 [Paenibacillus piri]
MAYDKNIFEKLNDVYRDTKARLTGDVFHDQIELNISKLKGIKEMTSFINKFSWIKREETIERFKFFLKSNLNVEQTAARFGINEDTIHSSIKYYSDKLKPIIEAPLTYLEESTDFESLEAAMKKFRRAVQLEVPNEYFLNGMTELFPEQKYVPNCTLDECRKELEVLGLFTHMYANLILKGGCNQIKLAHILSILNSDKGNDQDWGALKLFFDGEFSISDSGEPVSIQGQVERMFQWLDDQNPYNN